MKEIITTGKNIDEAMDKAVIELNVDRDLIEFEILDAPTSGFMGFGAKPARILARTGVRAVEEKKSQKPMQPAANKSEATKKAESEKKDIIANNPIAKKEEQKETEEEFVPTENGAIFVEEYLVDLFKNMSLKVNANVTQKDRIIEVKLLGEDVGLVIGKHGDTLDAIQHITQLAFNKRTNGAEKVRIDTEDYREKREKTLVGLAKSIANRVIKSKGKYELEPMKAYERRIIHSTLQSYPMITTYSIGQDQQRRIVVAFKGRENKNNS